MSFYQIWHRALAEIGVVVLDVIADVAYLINRKASDPRGFHKQPSRRRHNPDGSPNSSADCLGHLLCTEKFWSGGAIALPGVARRIHQDCSSNSRDILVGRRCIAAVAVHPREHSEMRG